MVIVVGVVACVVVARTEAANIKHTKVRANTKKRKILSPARPFEATTKTMASATNHPASCAPKSGGHQEFPSRLAMVTNAMSIRHSTRDMIKRGAIRQLCLAAHLAKQITRSKTFFAESSDLHVLFHSN
jgi:hypothetical protein